MKNPQRDPERDPLPEVARNVEFTDDPEMIHFQKWLKTLSLQMIHFAHKECKKVKGIVEEWGTAPERHRYDINGAR